MYGASVLTASTFAWPSGCRATIRFAEDAGVVNDGVHAADLVDLFRERTSLLGTC